MDDQDQTKYLEPSLILGTSFKDLMEEFKEYGSLIGMIGDDKRTIPDDLKQQDFVFVVGEPGQGKSRLLRELSAKAIVDGANTTVLDLRKRIGTQSLEDAIATAGENKDFEATKDENTLVCLDGLDEIPSSKFAESVQMLANYKKAHPGHKIITTSRVHFFAKYESSFSAINATYAMLLPLQREQQIEFLKISGLTNSDIDLVIQKLRYSDRELIIETPRYLEYFIKWYKATDNKDKQINRSDIFDYFVIESLKTDDEKIARKIAPLKRRTLEKLALALEITQTNSITQEEMVSFIDEYKSEAKQILFTALNDLEDFYNHGLIKDDGENISFDNAELQEYLAACAIRRMDKLNKVVFDLAVDEGQRMIHPSWYNTLSFVLEMHPDLLDQILGLQKSNPDQPERPEDPDVHKLVSGISAHLIPAEMRLSIFKRVFNYYIENDIYIDFEVSSRLAFYADDEAEVYVRRIATDLTACNEYKNLVNIASVIGKMQRVKALKPEAAAYWKPQLIDFAKIQGDASHLSVLKRHALHALEYFNDSGIISELAELHNDPDELVRRAFESMCDAIDPNDTNSINTFVEGIKNDNSSEARVSLLHITNRDSLEQLLQSMIDDQDFLEEMVKYESIFRNEDNQFFKNLDATSDEALLTKSKELIPKIFEIDSGYYLDRSEFASQLVKNIANHDPNYFAELLRWGLSIEEGRLIFDLQSHLANVMKLADVAGWAEAVQAQENINMKWHLFRVVPRTENVKNPNTSEIIEAARVALPEMFAEYEAAQSRGIPGPQDKVKEEFEENLRLADENKQPNNLGNALQIFNRQNNQSTFTTEEIIQLWNLTKEIALDPFDPAQATLRINPPNTDGSWTYTMSGFIHLFQEIVKFADKTGQNISSYRSKFIALLPFLLNEETEACLNLLGTVTDTEAQSLISIYSDSRTDRARYHPINFVEAANKLRIVDATPVLNQFVDENNFSEYVRIGALEASENLKPDKDRLKEIFSQYKDIQERTALAKSANALLITKHNDPVSVHWLIDKIRNSATEFVEQYGFGEHDTTPIEHELRSSENAKPLQELNDPQFIDYYLQLLEFSLELYARGDTWHSYAFYIWKVLTEYFTRLKDGLRFEPLERLEAWVAEHSTLPGINLFKEQMVTLRREYAVAINRPRNFNEALKIANNVHDNNRLSVSSSQQLVELVEKAIRERLIPWIEAEAHKVLNETHAQKLIRVQLENALMKEGFSPRDLKACHILREPQGLDDKRPDFLVYHGFIGPLVIEIKLFSNGDLTGVYEEKPSYESIQAYMRQYEAEHAIFFALDDELKTQKGFSDKMDRINTAYIKISGVRVLGARLQYRKNDTSA